jgi:hypothetical protein
MKPYVTDEEVRALFAGSSRVKRYKADFKHQDHLAVAVCYLQDLSVAEATANFERRCFDLWTTTGGIERSTTKR